MSPRILPVSSENQWFQRVETLKYNRVKRRRSGEFFVEGVRSINRLRADPRWKTEILLYPAGTRLSGWARDAMKEIDPPLLLEVEPRLMEKLSDREEGSELIAVVRMPVRGAPPSAAGPAGLSVVLDRPGNPGNLGSILRSCDAFGVDAVVVTGHAVDPYDPQVIRASAGAFFSQSVTVVEEQAALESWFRLLAEAAPGTRILGTSAKAAKPVTELPLSGPAVLCFGSETMGLSRWLKERCHDLAGIPMRGVASSLNLACAVTAVLFEAARQRSRA